MGQIPEHIIKPSSDRRLVAGTYKTKPVYVVVIGVQKRGAYEGYVHIETEQDVFEVRGLYVPCTFQIKKPSLEYALEYAILYGSRVDLTPMVSRTTRDWAFHDIEEYKGRCVWVDKVQFRYYDIDTDGNLLQNESGEYNPRPFRCPRREQLIRDTLDDVVERFPEHARRLKRCSILGRTGKKISPQRLPIDFIRVITEYYFRLQMELHVPEEEDSE